MTEGLTGCVAGLTDTVLGITGTMPGLKGTALGLSGSMGGVTPRPSDTCDANQAPFIVDWGGEIVPGFVEQPDSRLEKALKRAVKQVIGTETPNPGTYAFAVADLTDHRAVGSSPSTPLYAGVLDIEQRTVASLAKLLPLYGAFQLRTDLRALAENIQTNDLRALARELRDNYRRINAVTEAGPSGLPSERPWIENIFEIDENGRISFASDRLLGDNFLAVVNDQDYRGEPRWIRSYRKLWTNQRQLSFELDNNGTATGQLPFREHLRLMVGWSDNISASVVIGKILR